MIRINLLPYREILKKQSAINQLVVMAAVLVLILVVIVIADRSISGKVSALENQIAKTKLNIAKLNKRTAEIYRFQKDQKEFQRKLDKIDELNMGRKLPVHVLDEISMATPEKLWLTQMSRNGFSLVLNGIALDQETIVTFLNNLEKSTYLTNIRLIQTQQFSHQNLKLQKFTINGIIQPPQSQPQSPAATGGQKLG